MKRNIEESKNARFLALCAIAVFVITCMLAGCSDITSDSSDKAGKSIDNLIWSIPEASWEYCDQQLDQNPVVDCVSGNIIVFTPCIEGENGVSGDLEVVAYYYCHLNTCWAIETFMLTY